MFQTSTTRTAKDWHASQRNSILSHTRAKNAHLTMEEHKSVCVLRRTTTDRYPRFPQYIREETWGTSRVWFDNLARPKERQSTIRRVRKNVKSVKSGQVRAPWRDLYDDLCEMTKSANEEPGGVLRNRIWSILRSTRWSAQSTSAVVMWNEPGLWRSPKEK